MVDRPEIESGCFSACKADDHPMQSHPPYVYVKKYSKTAVSQPIVTYSLFICRILVKAILLYSGLGGSRGPP